MSRQRQNTIYGLARRINYRQVRRWQMYCFDCTDSNTIYIYTSKSYPCKALAVLGLSAKCRQCRQNPYLPKKKNAVNPLNLQRFLSGDGGIRTHDLYTASVALSQLSYAPESDVSVKTLPIIQENTRSFNIFFSKTSKIRESQIRASNS